MPPPRLHPRSGLTSSLFATTVVASFFVVGLPHILPCPAPRVVYADADVEIDGNGRRRRRRKPREQVEASDGTAGAESRTDEETLQDRTRMKTGRECPVPKPGGMIGELLGFHTTKESERLAKPPEPPRQAEK